MNQSVAEMRLKFDTVMLWVRFATLAVDMKIDMKVITETAIDEKDTLRTADEKLEKLMVICKSRLEEIENDYSVVD